MKRNGDLYPTHGLGPVSQCLGINRGNRYETLVSLGTKTRGLHLYAVERFGPDSPQAKETFKLSDVVITLLHTAQGEVVVLKHDTSSPRPYSRDILVQGTKGIAQKYPEPVVYIEGKSANDDWEKADVWLKQYDHPIWKELEEKSKGAGHGGMDFIEDYRLINALLRGADPKQVLEKLFDQAKDLQDQAKQQFESALKQFLAVTNVSSAELRDLEARYDRLNREYERSESRAQDVHDRITKVRQVAEPERRGDRKLRGVVEPWIPEPSLAAHFEVGHEGIPVGDRAPAGGGMQVDPCQAKGWRDEDCRRLAIRAEGFAIQGQGGIELARAPAVEHGAHRGLVDPQQTGERLQVGG